MMRGFILPRASYPTGARMGVLGDSQSLSFTSSATVGNWESKGHVTWLRHLSKQSLDISSGHVFATSGYKTADVIANWLSQAVAANLDFYLVLVGGNDIADSGTSVATTITNLETIYSRLLATGAILVVAPITPRTASMDSTTRAKKARVNNWIAEYARTTSNVILAKTNPYLVDATSATGDPISGVVQSDNLHLNTNGGYTFAKGTWEAINKFVSFQDLRILDATDVYDSTYNTAGSLITNGLLNGNGGTVSGTGNSGTAADSWTFANLTSTANRGTLTAVCSQVARTDGESGYWQQVVLSGTPTSIYTYFFNPSSTITTNFTAGVDQVYMVAEYQVDAGAAGLIQVGCSLTDSTFTARDPVYSFGTADANYNSVDAIHGVAKSEAFTITAGATALNPRIAISALNTAVSATIRIGRISLLKVI